MISANTDDVNNYTMSINATKKSVTFPVILLMLYILVEYGRPPFLAPLRPALILQIIFVFLIMKNFDKVGIIFKDKFFILYSIILIEMMIQGPIAVNNYLALMQWLSMISYLIFGLSFCLFVDDIRKLGIIITTFIMVHVLCATSRIMGSGIFGGSGPLGDKNDFALAMVVLIPLSFYMGLLHTGIKRLAFWIATALFVVANVSTMSRGAFLGMVSIGILMWLKSKSKVKSLAVIFLLLIAFVSLIPQNYKTEILSIGAEREMAFSDTTTSVDGRVLAKYGTGRDRVELWKVAWRMFLDNPIIGVGQDNLPLRMGEYQNDEHGNSSWQRDISGRAVHSLYFTLLAELGIVGFLVWMFMLRNLLSKYRYVSKSFSNNSKTSTQAESDFLKKMTLGFAVGMVGYLVSGAFLSAFYYPQFWNLAALITCSYMIQSKMELSDNSHVVPEAP